MKIPENEEEYIKWVSITNSIQWAVNAYNDNDKFNRISREKYSNNYEEEEKDEIIPDNKNGFIRSNKLLYDKFYIRLNEYS